MRRCRFHSLLFLPYRLLLVATFLTPFCIGGAYSQQQRDVRITEDIRELNLREDIRIQAAAELNGTRLVVWGTTVSGTANTLRNALVFDAGSGQQILHSKEAEPYGQVAIALLGDRFLLLWNDRRAGGEGIYGRTILEDGSFGGEEYLFSGGGRLVDRVYWQTHSGGGTVLWNDDRDDSVSVYLRRVDKLGKVVGLEESLGRGGIVENQVSLLSDGRIVLGRDHRDGLLLNGSGEIESREIPEERLRLPHYFGEDGSFAMLDSNLFGYYEHMQDDLPKWERRFKATGKEEQYDVAVIKRRVDTFVVIWPTFYFYWSEPRDRGGVFFLETRSSSFTSDQDSILTSLEYLDFNGVNDGVPATFAFKKFLGDCNGRSWVMAAVNRGSEAYYLSFYSVDVEGSMRYEGIDLGGNDIFEKNHLDSLIHCRPLQLPGTTRLQSDTVSSVIVHWADSSAKYATSTAGYRPSALEAPVIQFKADQVAVGWYRPETNQLGVMSFDQFPEPANHTSLQFRPNQLNTTTWVGPIQYQGGGGYTNLVIASKSKYLDGWPVTDVYLGIFAHLMKGSRWRRLEITEGWDQLSGSQWAKTTRVDIAGHDPNHDLFALAWENPYSSKSSAVLYSYNQVADTFTLSGTFPYSWQPEYILPIDERSVLLLNSGDEGMVLTLGEAPRSVELPRNNAYRTLQYRRLYGSSILREMREVGSTKRQLQLLSVDGMLRHSTVLTVSDTSTRFFVVQNPADSSIILLYGSGEGVYAYHFDHELRVISDPSGTLRLAERLSSERDMTTSPAGIIRNDSLFFVWLGENNQVYGNVVDLQKNLSTVQRVEDIEHFLSISPNPTTGTIHVQLPFSSHNVIVECSDSKGLALPIPVIEQSGNTLVLDMSGLASQVYFLRVFLEERIASGRVVVIR